MIVILQRNGDFLEAFGKDAEAVAKALGTVLVTRGMVQMAGIPLHAADESIAALKAAGLRPHCVDRKQGEKAIWRRTHADFKGRYGDVKTVLVFREGGTTIVPLADLRLDEIARLYPRQELEARAS